MGKLDAPLRAAARSLISELGATATLTRVTRAYAPGSGQANETTQQATVKISPPELYVAARVDGTMIQMGDARCIVSAIALEATGFSLPSGSQTNTYLTIGTDKWTVVSVNQLRSGDQIAALELQLRR